MPIRRGLTLIYTGDGKGKTSASLGLIVRAAAQGSAPTGSTASSGKPWRIAFLQFIKQWDFLSEHKTLRDRFPEVTHELYGEGFVGILGDKKPRQVHEKAAMAGITRAKQLLTAENYDLVILDEICGTVTGNLVPEAAVLELMDAKPAAAHLALTGRGATAAMIARADLVTEMREVKHPFQQGIQAQRGIDF